ncbi:MAG TPA: molecular chaperone HtpG [Candidatus Fimenecus stercoravium]|nr:molecular chaperone HtpG [Candidatus Fimenecus stercoravium]
MAKKQFKTESKRMLDLMINSIYTNREIFLRELISNASDAIDKLYFRSLTDDSVQLKHDDFHIDVKIDKDNRLLTVSDNGIGMTEEELDKNLGTIAKSGSRQFSAENETDGQDVDIIGQFGVGFYAAFMVADRVEVVSRSFGADKAYRWQSSGADGYTITEAQKDGVGTDVILHIKENTPEAEYDEFLETYTISSLVKKYSDYIRFPIQMDMEHSRKKEGSEDEYETYTVRETVNSMVPLWKKAKGEITQEEYEKFYQERFHAYDKPLRVIHQKAEGTTSYQALLFIPEKADYNYYSKNFEKGLALYSSGVKIMDKCADLLPDCFSFVKGVVDSEDLTLNISRETLQQDRQLKVIARALEKKIKKELADMLEKDREKYELFWKAFGLQLKYALYSTIGGERELLEDLLLFTRASDSKLCTLKEYVDAMPEGQKYIYYAAGESVEKLNLLPQAETVRDRGYDILFLTDDVDEFLMQILHAHGEKEFRSISGNDLGLESDEEKKENEEKAEAGKPMFEAMQKALEGKVSEVKLSNRLKTHPVCLSSKGAMSIEMEKVLAAMPNSENAPKAERVLELNGEHPVYASLTAAFEAGDTDKLAQYAKLLYDQACLMEGLSVDDPVAFSEAVCKLMQ